ncbi:hypothetical protein BRD01_00500 [Halobacteriales archaeon QS_8_65_32]|jgi:hypothetical protein|nr:MAG: hypothetical protein BRD01_00500 [Halobacteriales archaeon QS_8_65_32]
MEAWLRVAMAVVLVFAPSVLFVLLYRGLVRLQDQELIARLAEAGHLDAASVEGLDGTSDDDRDIGDSERERRQTGTSGRNATVDGRRAAFLRERGGPESRSTTAHRADSESPERGRPANGAPDARDVAPCPECGSENAMEFGLCWNCLEWIEG